MTFVRWIIGAAMLGGLTYAALLLFGPSDVVENRYDSLQAARNDNAWLPAILPASAHNILSANNLDLNTSEGEFSYSAQDDAAFATQLASFGATKHAAIAGYRDEVTRMQSKGYRVGVIAEAPSTWLFYCMPNKGFCKYRMEFESSDLRDDRY